jgi:hypothetical protein
LKSELDECVKFKKDEERKIFPFSYMTEDGEGEPHCDETICENYDPSFKLKA